MSRHSGTWTGRDPLVDEAGVHANTPEQRQAAVEVVRRFADTATLPELVAMLGLAGES